MIIRGYVIPEEIREPKPLEIYSTSGLYPNGDFKMNGVTGENLIDPTFTRLKNLNAERANLLIARVIRWLRLIKRKYKYEEQNNF